MRPDILTYTGKYFDFLRPDESDINIRDIAHSLSQLCRFNGHCKEFYSVAQHSLMVSQIVPPEYALVGLLHDAAEAYVGDVTAPLKKMIPDYKAIEGFVHRAIFNKFGLNPVLPDAIKKADLIMLATEQRDLMPPHDDEWKSIAGVEPLKLRILSASSLIAEFDFHRRFNELIADESQYGRIA